MMFTARSPSLFENDPRWNRIEPAPPRCRPSHRRPAQSGPARADRAQGNPRGRALRRSRPSAAGESGPAARPDRLSHSRELPAGQGRHRRKQALGDAVARHRSQPRAQCWRRSASISSRCMERLDLRSTLSATANPKSSTGRLDVFTRLIADGTDSFDYVPAGYSGPLYIEISPRSFSILVRQGSRLNQLRLLRRTTRQARDKRFLTDAELKALHKRSPLVDCRAHRARRPEPARRPHAADAPAADRLQGQAVCRRRRRRPRRRLRGAQVLGADLRRRERAPDPRPARVLHPGLQGGRGGAAASTRPRWRPSIP